MLGDMNFFDDPASALSNAVVKTNEQIHSSVRVGAQQSPYLHLFRCNSQCAGACRFTRFSTWRLTGCRHAVQQTTDDSLSGTTAVSVLIRGRDLTIANVGDSRCVAAEMRGADLVAVDLTLDQTPYR